jgi:hypothetical protein
MIGSVMRAAVAGTDLTTWHTAIPWSHSWLADDLTNGTATTWTSGTSAASATIGAGTPTRASTSGPNSQPGVTFASSDYMQALFTTIAQPSSIVVIGRITSTVTGSVVRPIIDSALSTDRNTIHMSSTGAWGFTAGTGVTGGTADTNNHPFTAFYNGASSVLEIDGSTIASGNINTQSLGNGITFGARYDGANVSRPVIAAIGVYSAGDVRAHANWDTVLAPLVSTKWGLTL